MTIAEFIAEWKKAELKERAAAQEHFLDLCHLLGHRPLSRRMPLGPRSASRRGRRAWGR